MIRVLLVDDQPLIRSGFRALLDAEDDPEVVAEAILVARGLSHDEIAHRMVIGPLTAKTHANRAKTKLHARDRARLGVPAYESGLVMRRGR